MWRGKWRPQYKLIIGHHGLLYIHGFYNRKPQGLHLHLEDTLDWGGVASAASETSLPCLATSWHHQDIKVEEQRDRERERESRYGHSAFQHCCNDECSASETKIPFLCCLNNIWEVPRTEDNSLPCNASVLVSEREGTLKTKTGSSNMFVEDASCLQSTFSYLSKLLMKRHPTPSVDIEEHFKPKNMNMFICV